MKTVQFSRKIYEYLNIALVFMLFKHSPLSKICINKVRCVLSGDWDRNNNNNNKKKLEYFQLWFSAI